MKEDIQKSVTEMIDKSGVEIDADERQKIVGEAIDAALEHIAQVLKTVSLAEGSSYMRVWVRFGESHIERFMKRLDENEEGEMGKDPDSVYEFKRTRSWWKLKDEDSEDGEIIDFEPGDPDSGFAHTLGKIVIRLENGVIVRASGIKHKYLDEIWNNQEKYRGRIVEVHCHEKTPDGSLRHPRLKWPKCLRDTEDRIGDKD